MGQWPTCAPPVRNFLSQSPTSLAQAVEGYDGSFELDTVSQEVLEQLLQNRLFLEQVSCTCGFWGWWMGEAGAGSGVAGGNPSNLLQH